MKQWIFVAIEILRFYELVNFLILFVYNIMLQHPWMLLAEYLKENWYTQKDFSEKIGKKTSEINELIRWKRNITVARDIILTKYLSTAPKFWIMKQVDFDYEQALLKDWEAYEKWEINTLSSWEKELEESNSENEVSSEKKTLQDIIEEERLQSKYLRENVFQETPISSTVDKVEDQQENKQENNIDTSNIPIKELLKEDPIVEATPLSQVFESF